MGRESRDRRFVLFLLACDVVVFVWSGVRPHNYFTWVLEVFPAVVGIALLAATYRRFRFTPLVYTLVCLHAMLLMVGGHYTYAGVPAFNWLRDRLHLARNDFDRVGHFAQGLVPALVARELLLRTSPLRRGKWLVTLVLLSCLGVSALYELVEWQTAVWTGSAANDFLGTQGDPWDTQEDMATALVGAAVALALFSPWQDRQLAKMAPHLGPTGQQIEQAPVTRAGNA